MSASNKTNKKQSYSCRQIYESKIDPRQINLFKLQYLNCSLSYLLPQPKNLTVNTTLHVDKFNFILSNPIENINLGFIQNIKQSKFKQNSQQIVKNLQQWGDFINYRISNAHTAQIQNLEQDLQEQLILRIKKNKIIKKQKNNKNLQINNPLFVKNYQQKQKNKIMNQLINNYLDLPPKKQTQYQLQKNRLYRQLFGIQQIILPQQPQIVHKIEQKNQKNMPQVKMQTKTQIKNQTKKQKSKKQKNKNQQNKPIQKKKRIFKGRPAKNNTKTGRKQQKIPQQQYLPNQKKSKSQTSNFRGKSQHKNSQGQEKQILQNDLKINIQQLNNSIQSNKSYNRDQPSQQIRQNQFFQIERLPNQSSRFQLIVQKQDKKAKQKKQIKQGKQIKSKAPKQKKDKQKKQRKKTKIHNKHEQFTIRKSFTHEQKQEVKNEFKIQQIILDKKQPQSLIKNIPIIQKKISNQPQRPFIIQKITPSIPMYRKQQQPSISSMQYFGQNQFKSQSINHTIYVNKIKPAELPKDWCLNSNLQNSTPLISNIGMTESAYLTQSSNINPVLSSSLGAYNRIKSQQVQHRYNNDNNIQIDNNIIVGEQSQENQDSGSIGNFFAK